jgi:hypothetical protein
VDTNAGLASAPARNTVSSTLQNNVEIHTINTSWRVIPERIIPASSKYISNKNVWHHYLACKRYIRGEQKHFLENIIHLSTSRSKP